MVKEEQNVNITYDVSKQKGSSRWYPHKVESPKVAAGPLGDMGVSYKDYMDMRRKKN